MRGMIDRKPPQELTLTISCILAKFAAPLAMALEINGVIGFPAATSKQFGWQAAVHPVSTKFFLVRAATGTARTPPFIRNIHFRSDGSIVAVAYGTAADALCFAVEAEAERMVARLASHRVFGADSHCVHRAEELGRGARIARSGLPEE